MLSSAAHILKLKGLQLAAPLGSQLEKDLARAQNVIHNEMGKVF